MILFARYYDKKTLVEVSMDEMETLITDEKNKDRIADYIFHRYYDRYIKVFDYKSNNKVNYIRTTSGTNSTIERDEFIEEYKNGFAMLTTSCLLVETISAFFEGQNESRKPGADTFRYVFEKAKMYDNPLQCFTQENSFYKNIRCGLLHQGETYGKFIIKRTGTLYDKSNKAINAKKFTESLKEFLVSYTTELKKDKWDSDLWDKCRVKLRHIIRNTK